MILCLSVPCPARHQLLKQLDLRKSEQRFAVSFLEDGSRLLIVRTGLRGCEWEPVLAIYDAQYRKRVELGMRRADGYERSGVHEFPAAGLQVLSVWQENV